MRKSKNTKKKAVKKEEKRLKELYFLRINDTIINIYNILKVFKPKDSYGDEKSIRIENSRTPAQTFHFSSEEERNEEFERISRELLV